MKKWFAIFSLTKSEQRLVVVLMLALLAVALLTKSHETRSKPPIRPLTIPSATPAPQEPD
jgi:hypothetical protein